MATDAETMTALRRIARRWRGALEGGDLEAAAREADAVLFLVEMSDTAGPPNPASGGKMLRELEAGALFQSLEELAGMGEGRATIYEARGNGWFSTPRGYDGGPWHAPELPVMPYRGPAAAVSRVDERAHFKAVL